MTILRLPIGFEHVDGSNVPTGLFDVPVICEPSLPVRGETRTNPHGPPKTIVLRSWDDEQALLHEILHVLLDGHIPDEQHGHPIINRIEVGLITAGYVRVVEHVRADRPDGWAVCSCGLWRCHADDPAYVEESWQRHNPPAPTGEADRG